MKVSRSEHLNQVFVLTADDVRSLTDILIPIGRTRYSAKCSDSLMRTFDNIDELLTYENPERKAVQSLTLRAFDDRVDAYATVSFDTDYRSNVFISIESDEAKATQVSERLQDLLSSVRPWYALVARTDFIWVALAVYLSFVAGLWAAGRIFRGQSNSATGGSTWWALTVGISIGLLPNVIGFLLNRMRTRYFPSGVFALGQGAKRYEKAEVIRSVVIAGFVISVISGIVTTLVLSS